MIADEICEKWFRGMLEKLAANLVLMPNSNTNV